MASSIQNLSSVVSQDVPSAKGMKMAIIRAEWNTKITSALAEGCKSFLLENEMDENDGGEGQESRTTSVASRGSTGTIGNAARLLNAQDTTQRFLHGSSFNAAP